MAPASPPRGERRVSASVSGMLLNPNTPGDGSPPTFPGRLSEKLRFPSRATLGRGVLFPAPRVNHCQPIPVPLTTAFFSRRLS